MPIPAIEKRRAARENMLAAVKRPGHSRSSSDDSSSSTESPIDGLARFGFGSRLAATSASPTSPPSLPCWKPPVGPQVQFTLPSFAKPSPRPPRFRAESEKSQVSVSPLTVVFPPEHTRQPERTRHRPPFLPLKSAMKPPRTTPSPPSVPAGTTTPRRIGTNARRVSVVVHPSLQTTHHTETDLDSPFTGGLQRTIEARTAGPLKVTFCEKDLTKPPIRDRLKLGHSRTHSGFF
ncbi:hypothetical protein DL96DRAFT_1591198 [Flagelloscypha sp. PMI_526]|nr:hypothetical protein DL96DRAFT_1591198 [Flagelloscypha sp. PMI_526]